MAKECYCVAWRSKSTDATGFGKFSTNKQFIQDWVDESNESCPAIEHTISTQLLESVMNT
jgi:hypothetical protein